MAGPSKAKAPPRAPHRPHGVPRQPHQTTLGGPRRPLKHITQLCGSNKSGSSSYRSSCGRSDQSSGSGREFSQRLVTRRGWGGGGGPFLAALLPPRAPHSHRRRRRRRRRRRDCLPIRLPATLPQSFREHRPLHACVQACRQWRAVAVGCTSIHTRDTRRDAGNSCVIKSGS